MSNCANSYLDAPVHKPGSMQKCPVCGSRVKVNIFGRFKPHVGKDK